MKNELEKKKKKKKKDLISRKAFKTCPDGTVTDAEKALDVRWVRLNRLRVADPFKPGMTAMDSPLEKCVNVT